MSRRRVCVYLGARAGAGEGWREAARHAGESIARSGRTLVYGGGSLGLMGVIADAALDAGGHVIGVIPRSMVEREQAHPRITEQHVVAGMHERKALLTRLSDGFLVLPGGFGTLDELFEAITWRQLELHDQRIGLWNVDGYYDALWLFLRRGRELGFMPESTFDAMRCDADLDALLDWL